MKQTFKLATLFNIPIEVNWSWFGIFGLVIFTLAFGYFPQAAPELSPLAHWLMAVISALLLFASLLAHELSHSIVAKRHNLPIQGITLFIFGGVAHLEEEPASPSVEFKMAIAGPAMSLLLALFFWAVQKLLALSPLPYYFSAIAFYLTFINLAVAVFNLIPGFPLDGGRVLRSVLWAIFKDVAKATRIASAFGRAFALLMMALGLLYFFNGYFINGLWLIFIGLFLQEAATSGYRQLMLKKILSGIPVRAIMTREVIAVPPDLTINRLLDDYFFRFRFAAFPVVEEDKLLGLVTFHAVKEIARDKWEEVAVKEIMVPLNSRLLIRPDIDAVHALGRIAANGYGRLLVVEKQQLIGLVSQRDILRLFELRTELGR
jgi:Zn-dependent protease/CBS domain-containing protein